MEMAITELSILNKSFSPLSYLCNCTTGKKSTAARVKCKILIFHIFL